MSFSSKSIVICGQTLEQLLRKYRAERAEQIIKQLMQDIKANAPRANKIPLVKK